MKASLVSMIYADALFSIAADKQSTEKELNEFMELWSRSRELYSVLNYEIFKEEEKKLVLEDLFSKAQFSNHFKNFIYLLLEVNRISLLPTIRSQFDKLHDDESGIVRGTVRGRTADIPEDHLKQIKNFIEKNLSKKPTLSYENTNSISAGYKVLADDLILDATIDGQLDQLKKNKFFGVIRK